VQRGRPRLEDLLQRVDEHVALLHHDYGGLPRTVEADEILREIWIEDTYHSSALEGNPLSKRQVRGLLDRGRASGSLPDALEIEGYSRAARWVYVNAADYPVDRGVPVSVVRQVHQLLVTPRWAVDPPDDGTSPGDYRRRGVQIAGSTVRTTRPVALAGTVQDWTDASGYPGDDAHQLLHVARHHAWFERIHPFADANGRTGRLLMNFMLLQRGYPPAVLLHTSRGRYLRSLALADPPRDSPSALTELIARAIESNINRFLIPELAGRRRLVPLPALAEYSGYSASYLRNLAGTGRLRATREGRLWLSSRAWVDDYKTSRSNRGRRPSG
jgi:Fic family protein